MAAGWRRRVPLARLRRERGLVVFAPRKPLLRELLIAHRAQRVGIERKQFGTVKLAVGLADTVDREVLREERSVELLEVLAVRQFHARIPAQEREKVVDGLRGVARIAEVGDFDFRERDFVVTRNRLGHGKTVVLGRNEVGEFLGVNLHGGRDVRGLLLLLRERVLERLARSLRLVALAHLGAIHIEDERHVAETGRREAKRAIQRKLPRRVAQVFLSPHDVRDAHRMVINDHGEVVHRKAITPADDEVIDLARSDLDVAQHLVRERDFFVGREEANHVRLAAFNDADAVLDVRDFFKARPAIAIVSLGLLRGLLLRRKRGLIFERGVGLALLDEAHDVGVVGVKAAGLKEGTDLARVAAHDRVFGLQFRTLVPMNAQPRKVFHDALGGLIAAAGGVGVFDAEEEVPTVTLGKGPAEEGGACAADVEVAGGARGEAGDDRRPAA